MYAGPRRYEVILVSILGVIVGLMCFDQSGINYLIPFIKPSLNLSNTQVGQLLSVYWGAFGVSSCATSVLADSVGRHKTMLIVIVAALSVSSSFAGLAHSFNSLLAARTVMGFLEGPILPVTQAIIALESPAERRGTNMGIVGSFGANAFGGFLAPLILVRIGSLYDWRAGFYLVIAPGLICVALLTYLIHEPTAKEGSFHNSAAGATKEGGRISGALAFRNVWLCIIICIFYVAYNAIGFAFQPLFYLNVRHLTTQQMSLLMGFVGIAAMLFSVLLPTISDRVGRKPVLIVANLASIVCPLGALYYVGPFAVLGIFPLIGWALSGTGSLFMGTIPSETVPTRSISTAMGFIVGLGVLGGGLLAPLVAGWSADRWGPHVPLWLQIGCAVGASMFSCGLCETAPGSRKRTDAALVTVP